LRIKELCEHKKGAKTPEFYELAEKLCHPRVPWRVGGKINDTKGEVLLVFLSHCKGDHKAAK
ncbi:MAG: hypothetical protein ACKOOI_11565, partial [Pirellula sp.]